jgi:hypothetical protein
MHRLIEQAKEEQSILPHEKTVQEQKQPRNPGDPLEDKATQASNLGEGTDLEAHRLASPRSLNQAPGLKQSGVKGLRGRQRRSRHCHLCCRGCSHRLRQCRRRRRHRRQCRRHRRRRRRRHRRRPRGRCCPRAAAALTGLPLWQGLLQPQQGCLVLPSGQHGSRCAGDAGPPSCTAAQTSCIAAAHLGPRYLPTTQVLRSTAPRARPLSSGLQRPQGLFPMAASSLQREFPVRPHSPGCTSPDALGKGLSHLNLAGLGRPRPDLGD